MVYFDQRVLCRPFADRNHSFLFFLTLKQLFPSISAKKCLKNAKNNKKHVKKEVYQHLGVTLKNWLTPKSWLTPGENVIYLNQFYLNMSSKTVSAQDLNMSNKTVSAWDLNISNNAQVHDWVVKSATPGKKQIKYQMGLGM